MAKNENKEVVEEIQEQPKEQKEQAAIKTNEEVADAKINTPVEKEGGDMKMKAKPKKPKQFVNKEEDEVIKVDLTKKAEEEDKVEEKPVEEEVKKEEEKPVEEVKEEAKEEEVKEEEEQPVVEEITDEEVKEKVEEKNEEVVEAIKESKETGEPLPENIQKVVDFMKDTGGSLEDYVRLNQDYSDHDDISLLREYYKQTKPHLTDDEVSFIMDDQFSYDEEADEARDIKRKKLALKEQVAGAKTHLDGLKSKYYEEIKAGSKLTQDQQKAVEFFNRYNEEKETTEKATEAQKAAFLHKTDKVFNDDFKGFEYNLGDKRFRFNVKNSEKVKESQSDINNFFKKFLDDKQVMNDAAGYHKSLYTAMNPDAVAKHFYEQGKADAIKDSMAKSKNINMDPRKEHTNSIPNPGWSVKAVPGDSASDFKVRIKK